MPEVKYKKSVFGHFFFNEKICCAYNALKLSTIYFPISLYEHLITFLNTGKTPPNIKRLAFLIGKLKQSAIIIPIEYNELSYLKIVQKSIFQGVCIRVMVLHLTDYCNLKCKYCFIEGNIDSNYTRKIMSKETMRKSIDKFVEIIKKNNSKNPSIVFYGGEPLLNWEVLIHGLEYIEKNKYIYFDKILITNGTVISDNIAKQLKEHNVSVSVSIDGPEQFNDTNRVYHSQKGSFKDIWNGINMLRKAGITPSVSCVLSKQNVNYASEIIKWLVEDIGIKALGFNHVSIIPNLTYYDSDYENSFAQSILNVQEIIQSEYKQIYERRMNHKINCFIDKRIIRADCTGCGEQFSVSPTGEIGICQGYMGNRKTFNGSVYDLNYFPSDDKTFIEWSYRSPLNMPDCYSCSALSTCGGGCPRNADVLNGSIWEKDTAFCHFAKKAQEWLIWNCKRF